MRLALMGQKLGHQVFIVIEQLSEIDVLLQVADEMDVTPTAGVRIKLASRGFGRWAESGGEKSKFGLNAAQLVQAIDKLTRGRPSSTSSSSSTSTSARRSPTSASSSRACRSSRASTSSCATHGRSTSRTWTSAAGSAWTTTARNSTSDASVNYSLQEYANDVVYTLAEACREHELPMPHIISESGRALTAHHALLLIKVIDVESRGRAAAAAAHRRRPPAAARDGGRLQGRRRARTSSRRRVRESLPRRDVRQGTRARATSTAACLSLRERALAEQIYFATINVIARDRAARTATSSRTSSPTSTRRSSTATSATSRSSSRCPTAGRSTSSSRSCPSTGWTRSRRGAARCRT